MPPKPIVSLPPRKVSGDIGSAATDAMGALSAILDGGGTSEPATPAVAHRKREVPAESDTPIRRDAAARNAREQLPPNLLEQLSDGEEEDAAKKARSELSPTLLFSPPTGSEGGSGEPPASPTTKALRQQEEQITALRIFQEKFEPGIVEVLETLRTEIKKICDPSTGTGKKSLLLQAATFADQLIKDLDHLLKYLEKSSPLVATEKPAPDDVDPLLRLTNSFGAKQKAFFVALITHLTRISQVISVELHGYLDTQKKALHLVIRGALRYKADSDNNLNGLLAIRASTLAAIKGIADKINANATVFEKICDFQTHQLRQAYIDAHPAFFSPPEDSEYIKQQTQRKLEELATTQKRDMAKLEENIRKTAVDKDRLDFDPRATRRYLSTQALHEEQMKQLRIQCESTLKTQWLSELKKQRHDLALAVRKGDLELLTERTAAEATAATQRNPLSRWWRPELDPAGATATYAQQTSSLSYEGFMQKVSEISRIAEDTNKNGIDQDIVKALHVIQTTAKEEPATEGRARPGHAPT
ncbi:MAG: hypothetical protein A3C55_02730 [Gammaproteobacteria bacterium RIFCSPHIGHO2_02_FULL_42_13]|nr:MAG: hypothetical protein A3C55_02730 [Gammaproteobacteria bacterium RIFCSPHIGHO2_02_FULL_42_13]